MPRRTEALLLALLCAACGGGTAEPQRLMLGATHTLEDSGLLGALREAWAREHGSEAPLSIVVAGSGEILALARRGDVDVVLSHSPVAELAIMREGVGVSREPVMHNEFVLLGPPSDPARAREAASPADALRRIAEARLSFVSRGDDSGTHQSELGLWQSAGVQPIWDGYIEAGAGMADALRVASQSRAYILSDRATYSVIAPALELAILHEGGDGMHNQYSVIVLGNAANPEGARRFGRWIRGPIAQQLIGRFGRDSAGQPLFVPDARPD